MLNTELQVGHFKVW